LLLVKDTLVYFSRKIKKFLCCDPKKIEAILW